jgi:hypothetical protein
MKEVGETVGLEEQQWAGQVLSSISTGCLRRDKVGVGPATEAGCEDCDMGCATGTTVEPELLVEIDRLSVRQECR